MFLYSTNQDMFHHICSTSHMIFAVVGPNLSLCGDSHPYFPTHAIFILWTRWLCFICMAATPLEIVSMLVSTIIVCHVPCPSLICGGAPGRPTSQDKNQKFAAKFCCMLDPLYFNHLKTNIYLQIKFAPKIESILFWHKFSTEKQKHKLPTLLFLEPQNISHIDFCYKNLIGNQHFSAHNM